jgi:hypothetical protein
MIDELIIKVQRFNDPNLPDKFLATIPSKPGMVVSGRSTVHVLHELSLSIHILEKFEQKSILDQI